LRGDKFHRADEARRIAGGEQLLRIVADAAGAAEFLRRGQLDVEAAVFGGGMAIATAGGGGPCRVENIH
jgi:hypothetical protein